MTDTEARNIVDSAGFADIRAKANHACAIIRQIGKEKFLPSCAIEAAQADTIGRIATNEVERS